MTKILLFVSIILAIFTGCSSPKSPALPAGKEDTSVISGDSKAQEMPKEEWQAKWDKTLQEAKREGKVVIYGGAGGQVREALIREFYNKYGILTDYTVLQGAQVPPRILSERRAGLYIPDAIIGAGSPSINVLKSMGVFDLMEPILILPEVMDSKGWWNNRFPWVDKEHYFIAFLAYASPKIVINTDIVKPEEINSYRDLLDPKWTRKIVMYDPTIAGAGQNLMVVLAHYLMDVGYLRQLAAQEPFIARDQRLLVEWVARGKYLVDLAPDTESVEQLRSAGVPLQYATASEGNFIGYGNGFLSRPKNAPHPNASTLFINWLLSREGQFVYTDAARIQSAREDITTTNVNPLSMRQPGVKYVSTSTEEFQLRVPQDIELFKEIFGHLIIK